MDNNTDNCKINIAIDSYRSIEALIDMINEMLSVFGITNMVIEDMFHYGVFCKAETYAGFQDWESAINAGIEVPTELYGGCNSFDGKVAYINQVISDILENGKDKPDWMIYVEENEKCNGLMPSTFLILIPTEDYYDELGQSIINFLYSTKFSANTYSCGDGQEKETYSSR